jgi:hypothetical protein
VLWLALPLFQSRAVGVASIRTTVARPFPEFFDAPFLL